MVSVLRMDDPGACLHPHALMLIKCLLPLPGPFLLPEITLFPLPNTQVQQEKKEREKENWKITQTQLRRSLPVVGCGGQYAHSLKSPVFPLRSELRQKGDFIFRMASLGLLCWARGDGSES